MKSRISIFLPLLLFFNAHAQEHCFNDKFGLPDVVLRNETVLYDYARSHAGEMPQSVITIPVVVHIVWNTPSQNISNAQVLSQINVLNKDFRRLNADTVNTPAPFIPIAADAQLQFCLAQRDPSGNPTTGITRTQTSVFSFAPLLGDTSIYYTSTGGHDAWDTASYLNIWVCNSGGGMATPPGYTNVFPGLQDGVVIDPTCFGDTGTVVFPTNKGRLCDHEIGHYFFLFHPWGNDTIYCSTDSVADTPPQKIPTLGCPTFPLTDSCSPGFPGIVFPTYMDYTDDACMNLFTAGQAARMNWCIQSLRPTLLTSQGCMPPTGYSGLNSGMEFDVAPNPSPGIVTCSVNQDAASEIILEVTDVPGKIVLYERLSSQGSHRFTVDLSPFGKGVYFFRLRSAEGSATRIVIIR